MTTRRPSYWHAMGGGPWKKFSSTWRAAWPARPRNDGADRERPLPTLPRLRGREGGGLAATDRRDDAAVLVPAALVVAAAAGSRLLADGANGHLGLPAILHHEQCRLLRPRRRHFHRCGAVVGHPVPRPARLLDFVPGGDVVAQPRQPDDEPAAADRVHRRIDGHERGAAVDRRSPGDVSRHRLLRLLSLRARGR